MTKFLRTFTHISLCGTKSCGALVDDLGVILFVQAWGWYEVDQNYIDHHDAKLRALEKRASEDEFCGGL